MRTILFILTVFFILACTLPLNIMAKCGIPGIHADRENQIPNLKDCVELAFEQKWEAECKAEGFDYKPAPNQIGWLKSCVHRKRIMSVWDEWLSSGR